MNWIMWSWPNGYGFVADEELEAATVQPFQSDSSVMFVDSSAHERWLIERAYAWIAGEAVCAQCGAALTRGRTISTVTLDGGALRMIVSTRCGNWKRHFNRAEVTQDSGDLVFGTFKRTDKLHGRTHRALHSLSRIDGDGS